jgi:hypothetical protein
MIPENVKRYFIKNDFDINITNYLNKVSLIMQYL